VEAIHYSAGAYPPGDTRLLSFGTGSSPHPVNPKRASFLQWAEWVLIEMLEDAAEWQTFITKLEYGGTGRIDFRRYNLDLAPDVFDELGVKLPPGTDLTRIGIDSLWAIELLVEIGRAFAQRIDFEDPEGLILRSRQGGAPPVF
jgi:hypothetical protein